MLVIKQMMAELSTKRSNRINLTMLVIKTTGGNQPGRFNTGINFTILVIKRGK